MKNLPTSIEGRIVGELCTSEFEGLGLGVVTVVGEIIEVKPPP